MRILLTTDTIGGVWSFTAQLSQGLLERGHEVALVSFGRMPGAGQSAWADRLSTLYGARFRFTASVVALEWMPENSDLFERTAAVLDEVVRDFSPDVLHANQFCAAMYGGGSPSLLTVHSDVLSWAEACRPGGLAESPWLARYRRTARAGLVSADAVVAPTQWLADAVQRIYELECGIDVVPNGCTLTVQTSAPRKLQAVTAGRFWDEGKGLALLTELRSPMPLLIAGEKPEPVPALPPGTSLLGSLHADALHALFRESAIYLATSLYEPFGLAPLEAALCGCAVIARGIPSLREVWADGALYFDDAETLRLLLTRLASDPAEMAEAQARSHARALRYSANAMTESYVRQYDLLPSRRGSEAYELTARETHAY